jgi:hypothetical protein
VMYAQGSSPPSGLVPPAAILNVCNWSSTMATIEEANEIKRKHSLDLLKKPGVCGVDVQADAQGKGVIHIHLDPNLASKMPTQLDGVPVKCEFTGPFRKQ